ncbi:MAG: ferrous iron transport protein B [Archaeoglobaceae archaeon]|nr:ferrous iron transport protein B [Archaeoglobaceae archaeon]MDW8117653.1 ferrous iron transport protein B [Archaeoglobaceae archaeon]
MQNKIYLIAQPNSGKTTLFNLLACENCYVANWPGKTVEVFQAKIVHHGRELLLVDLPGINSFKTLGREESLTKEFIMKEDEGIAVVIVNGESLYRSFYFAIQVLEMKKRSILVINKSDYLEKRGVHINLEILKEKLGVEVVQISALHGTGINQLMDRILDILDGRIKGKRLKINYGTLESYINKAEAIIGSRSLAIKAIEGEEEILTLLPEEKRREIEKIKKEIEEKFASPEEIIAMHRHKFVENLLNSAVKEVKVARSSFEEGLDKIFFSKLGAIFSILILFSTLFVAFTVNTGFPLNLIIKFSGNETLAELLENLSLVGIISMIFDYLSELLDTNLPDSPLKSLFINGILAGIGAVASFFPLILILNFLMSLVEDSGIMARIATSMDRFFSFFGLTGKSVFPFGVNLSCNVPGVMASRILETDAERIRVALASSFVICQARLLVIILFAIFFLASAFLQSAVVISIYLLSTFMFLLATKVYGKAVKEETSDLLIELPPYHLPNLKVVWWITWERSKSFILKISQILLLFAILAWFINYIGIANLIGAGIAKILSPFGLEDPRLGFALLMGFFAKELIISSLAVSFGTSDLIKISNELALSTPQATALIVFTAFYTPCIATISAIHSEVRNYKLLFFSIAFQLLSAYLLALLTFLILSYLI